MFANMLYGIWNGLIDKGQKIQLFVFEAETVPFHQVYFKTAMLEMLY